MKIRQCMLVCLPFVVVLLSGTALWSKEPKTKRVSAAPMDDFEIRNIEGWAVYIKKQDLVDHAAEMAGEIDHLQNQFYQVRLTVPAPAVAVMQERVPLWMEYDSSPGLSFHPSYKWLLDRGHASPEGLSSLVSNCRARDFSRHALHQPWVVLHEMAHGYDYLYLGEGRRYSNPQIKAVFERAKAGGTYESVLCRYSTGTRHYAMSNEMEYLAENTEAYFGTNDFYPFVRAELKEHDPDGYALLQAVWGVDAKKQARVTRSLVSFIESGGNPAGPANSPTAYALTSGYQKRRIEGWTVHVSPLLVEQKAYADEMCKLLRYKLHLVKRYMPGEAVGQLQKVPIWLERDNPAVSYMTYHACPEKLKAAGQNPDKLHGVEIGNTARFRQWQGLQQFAVLNQLARAYYDRLPQTQARQIKDAWRRAVESGRYDSVLRFDAKRVRHPALKDPLEFFAEMTESYYGVNDHFPFLQFETRQYDPETCRLLEKIWGGKAK